MRGIIIAICIFSTLLSTINAQSIKENITALLKDAPVPGPQGYKKKLPAKVEDIKLAYFGVFALMKFSESKRLGIYNIAQAKFQKMLSLKSTNFIYATGSDMLVVYYPDMKILETYSLTSFAKTKVKKISLDGGFITNIEMGAAVKTKAIVSGAKGGDALDRRWYGMMDLKTFAVTMFKESRAFHNSSYRDRIHLRANNAMTKVTSWCTSHSPTGFIYVSLADEVKGKYEHSSYGSINFSNNDNVLLTTSGYVTNTDGQKLRQYPKSKCYPILGGDFYIQYTEGQYEVRAGSRSRVKGPNLIKIRDLNSHSIISEHKSPVPIHEFRFSYRDMPNYTADKFLLAAKVPERMLLIDNKALYAYTMNLGLQGQTGPGAPPQATIGKPWSFALGYPKGTKVLIEDGPDGMVYDPAKSKINWPAPTTKGLTEVLISVIKPGEEEFYKEFKIWVK